MIDLLQIEQSFDSFKRADLPSITLCKPTKEPIFSIERLIYETSLSLKFNDISNFNFSIPKIISYKDKTINAYSSIKTKKLIHIEKVGYFIISKILEKEDGGSPILEVECESIESELLYKRFFLQNEETTINFYDKYTVSNENGVDVYMDIPDARDDVFINKYGVNPKYFRTVLERIFEQCPDWSAGYIDKEIVWHPNEKGELYGPITGLPSDGTVYVPKEDIKTESLIHFNDPLGSTLISDEILDSFGWNVYGNARIDDFDYKFGTSSLYTDGTTNSYIRNTKTGMWDIDNDSLTSSWTVDFWTRLDGEQTNFTFIKAYMSNNAMKYWRIGLENQNLIFEIVDGVQKIKADVRLVYDSPNIRIINWVPGVWHHVAVSKTAERFTLFIDGVKKATAKESYGMDGYNICEIGRNFKGWIDEVRVCTAARWDDDFDIPVNPYRGKPIEMDNTQYPLYTKRTFSIDDSTVYDFLINDVQKSFSCFIIFDIENKKINAFSTTNQDKIRKQTDLFLSYDNLLLSSEFIEFTDEIATALYCSGGGNLGIYEINPLGTKVIYDYTYYKNLDWMNQDLIDALDAWDKKTQTEIITQNTVVKDSVGQIVSAIGTDILNNFFHFLKHYDGTNDDSNPVLHIIAMTKRRAEVDRFLKKINQIETNLSNEDFAEVQSMADLVASQKVKREKKKANILDPKYLSDYKKNMNFLLYGKIEMHDVDGVQVPILPSVTHTDPEYRLVYKENEMVTEDVYKWEQYGSLKSDEINNPSFVGIEDKVWNLTKEEYYKIEKLDTIDYVDRVVTVIDKLEGELNLKGWNSGDDADIIPSTLADWEAALAEREAEIAAQIENLYAISGTGSHARGKKNMYRRNIQWLNYGTITTAAGNTVKSVVPPKFLGDGGKKAQLNRDNLYGFDIFGPLNNIYKIVGAVNYYVEKLRDSMVFINDALDLKNIDNFTVIQQEELSKYTIENTYQNENITINSKTTSSERIKQARLLYQQAVETFQRIREPRFEFTINITNFLALQKYSPLTNNLSLGSEVTIETNKGLITAVLLEIDTSYDDVSSLDLTFSNKIRRVGKEFLYSEMMGQIIKNSQGSELTKTIISQQSLDIKNLETLVNANVDLSRVSIISNSTFGTPDFEINKYGMSFKEKEEGKITGFGITIKPSGIFYTDDNYETSTVLIGKVEDPNTLYQETTEVPTVEILGTNAGIVDSENNIPLLMPSLLSLGETTTEYDEINFASAPSYVGFGINAEALKGKIRPSKELKILSDNGFSKMTVDENGVQIKNANLIINKNGAGISLDPEEGLKIGRFVGDNIIYPTFHGDMDGNLTLRATIYAEKGNIGGWDIKKEGIFSPEEIKDSSFMKYQGAFDETIFKIKDVLKINNDNTGIFTGNVLSSKIQGKILLENVSLENNTSDVNFITKNKFIVDADKGIYFHDKINVNGEEAVSGSFTVGTTTFRFVNGILVEVTTTP